MASNPSIRRSAVAIAMATWLATPVAVAAVPEDILKGAWNDPRLDAHKQAVRLVEKSGSFNPFSETQLKIERGEIDKEDLEFGLRLYPRGYSEASTARRYRQALLSNEQLLYRQTLSQTLGSKYLLLAKTALIKGKLDLSRDLADLASRSDKVLAYSAQKDRAEIRSFLKARSDLQKVDLKVAEIKRDVFNLERELKNLGLPEAEKFDLKDLISADEIKSRLATVQSSESLSAEASRLDAELSLSALSFDQAKTSRWLDYFEVSMKESSKGEKIFGLEVAINLPWTGAPDMSDIEKAASGIRARGEGQAESKAANTILQDSLTELKVLLDLRETLAKSKARMTPEQLKRATQTIGASDPLLALELQRGWYEAYEHILDTEFRIRELYILVLQESSTLAREPEVNHFSKTAKRIL